MADNVNFTPGTGATGATDDIGGVHYPRVKLGLGSDGTAVDAVAGAGVNGTGVQRVTVATDDAMSAAITADSGFSSSVAITRPADTTAYTANDCVGGAQTFSSIGPSGGKAVMITGAELLIEASAIISGESNYRLHLYSVTPPGAYSDNTAWDLPSGDRASYLGFVDLGAISDMGSTLYAQATIQKPVKLAGTSVFGYLVTLNAYTPTASRVYNVKLHTMKV